jgi:Recombination endonuclease VII
MSASAEQRDARNARRREQRAQDPDRRAKDNARQRAYYQANKQKYKDSNKAYYDAHREEIKKRNSAYYQANKETISEQARASRLARKHANDPSLWSGELRRRYGMSPAEYAALLAKQGGACAICRKRSKGRLCVDHCHVTGTVRGLLCHACNLALGSLKEDQASLVAALAYLGALPRDGPGSAAQRALAVHAVLPPWPTRRAVLTHPPVRCDAPPTSPRVPTRCSAKQRR